MIDLNRQVERSGGGIFERSFSLIDDAAGIAVIGSELFHEFRQK
jgi:hypothetical protein